MSPVPHAQQHAVAAGGRAGPGFAGASFSSSSTSFYAGSELEKLMKLTLPLEEVGEVERDVIIQTVCDHVTFGDRRLQFPGAQPVSLTREVLLGGPEGGATFKASEYAACEKTDGDRMFWLEKRGRVFLIDRKCKVLEVRWHKNLHPRDEHNFLRCVRRRGDWLLDGELCVERNRCATTGSSGGRGSSGHQEERCVTFMLFDCMVANGQDVTQVNLTHRLLKAAEYDPVWHLASLALAQTGDVVDEDQDPTSGGGAKHEKKGGPLDGDDGAGPSTLKKRKLHKVDAGGTWLATQASARTQAEVARARHCLGRCFSGAQLRQIREQILGKRVPLPVRSKQFYPMRLFEKLLAAIPRLGHENDGFVFTPLGDPYTCSTCPRLLKWKPLELNTVDFRTRMLVGSGGGAQLRLLMLDNHELVEFGTCKNTLEELRELAAGLTETEVAGEETEVGETKPEDDGGDTSETARGCTGLGGNTSDPRRKNAKDELEAEREMAVRRRNHWRKNLFSEKIWECRYDLARGGFVLYRLRADKDFPNARYTVDRVLAAMRDNLTLDDIRAKARQ